MENEYYAVPAISNSGMGSINPDQGGSPLRYKTYVKDRKDISKESPSLQNGKLVHLYVEKPNEFLVSDLDRPTEMLASWVEEVFESRHIELEDIDVDSVDLRKAALAKRGDRYKSFKDDKAWEKFTLGFDYLAFLINRGDYICVSSNTKELLEACINSLRINKVASKLLFDDGEMFGDESFNEMAIYWNQKTPGKSLRAKALLDRVKVNNNDKVLQLIDLKTTSKPVSKFDESFEFWRYYRQMAWYKNALKIWSKEKGFVGYDIEVYMVVVETTGVFESRVFKVSDAWLTKCTKEYKDLLDRISMAEENDQWLNPKEALSGIQQL